MVSQSNRNNQIDRETFPDEKVAYIYMEKIIPSDTFQNVC